MRKGIGPRGLGASPLKQTKEVKVKDVPKVVANAVENAAGEVAKGAKNLVNKIGNITLSTPEGQKRRAEKKKERVLKRAEKAEARLNRQYNKADAKTK
jgi:hypothetical protein